jgi:hypothetical protein
MRGESAHDVQSRSNTERFLLAFLKTGYALLQTAVFPLALWYALAHGVADEAIPFVYWSVYFIIPLWAFFFIGFAVYRFPSDLRSAAFLVAAPVWQCVAVFFSYPGQALFSAYTLFLASFAGLIIFFSFYFYLIATRKREFFFDLAWWGWMIVLLSFFAHGALFALLIPPLFRDLSPSLESFILFASFFIQVSSVVWQCRRIFIVEADQPTDLQRSRSWENGWGMFASILIALMVTASMLVALAFKDA